MILSMHDAHCQGLAGWPGGPGVGGDFGFAGISNCLFIDPGGVREISRWLSGRRGGPDAALSVWVVEQQEDTEDTLGIPSLLLLRHPDIQSDAWAIPPT